MCIWITSLKAICIRICLANWKKYKPPLSKSIKIKNKLFTRAWPHNTKSWRLLITNFCGLKSIEMSWLNSILKGQWKCLPTEWCPIDRRPIEIQIIDQMLMDRAKNLWIRNLKRKALIMHRKKKVMNKNHPKSIQ